MRHLPCWRTRAARWSPASMCRCSELPSTIRPNVPMLGTAIYNQAKRSPCTLRFHIATEAGWDLGGASALLIAAGLLLAGVPIGTCILLSLLGALASFYLLRTYFAALKPTV